MKASLFQVLIAIVLLGALSYLIVIALSDKTKIAENSSPLLDTTDHVLIADSIEFEDNAKSAGGTRDLFEFLYNFDENDAKYQKRHLSNSVTVYDYSDLRVNKIYWDANQASEISITNKSDTAITVNALKYIVSDQSNNALYEGYISLGDKDIFSTLAESINNPNSSNPRTNQNKIQSNKAVKLNVLDTNNPTLDYNEKISLWIIRQ